MLKSHERAYSLARAFLGPKHEARDHLMLLVKRELDEQAAEAIELVRQLRPHLAVASPAGQRLLAAITEFLAAHGVTP